MSHDKGSAAYFGRALAALRAERGYKRADLKDRSGLSYPYISELENGGKYPSQRAIESLAKALDLGPFDLLTKARELELADDHEIGSGGLTADPNASSRGESTHFDSGPRKGSISGDDDEIVSRLSDQIMASVMQRLTGWLEVETMIAVRNELNRLKEAP